MGILDKTAYKNYLLVWIQPICFPSTYPVFKFINYWEPGGGFWGGFEDRDSKVLEIIPLDFTIDSQDSANVHHFSRVAVPAEDLTFVVVDGTSRSFLIEV